MAAFTHLQVLSGYSLMNSTITVDKLVNKAKELDFQALALTDEQVLSGVIPFYKKCRQEGIKPIIGMTVYVKSDEQREDTCILLAKNNQGYQQLVKLSSYIQTNQFNAIEKENLQKFTTGIIGIFPATNAKLKSLIRSESHEEISAYIDTWKNCFAANDFYLGVADHGGREEKEINASLKAFQNQGPLPVVAINDVRYLDAKDAIAYDCLQAMKVGKQWEQRITDPSIKQHHLRSETEMEVVFQDWPEVLKETEQITEACTVTFDFHARMLPSFPVPEQMDAHTYLEKQCWNKLEHKYKEITEDIAGRLAYELQVIKSMQFSDYFLIVADFIAFAKNNHIMVGPGRGSAAGSLVAYVLGITEVDPLKYNLLFERFLNPERVTMPDIDVDFSDHRRDEVIDYVRDKYGTEHVAQIITFGTFAARSLVRELIKTIGIDQQDAQFILREIPVNTHKSIVDYVRESADLKQYIKQSNKLKALFAIAAVLEGLPRHISTHAAGVVISEKPLMEHVPLTVGANDTRLTQYSMNNLEAIGLLKIDFLGLRNLTLLERIVQTIHYTAKETIELDKLPENDAATFSLLQKGMTNGVFQLESQGMKEVLTRLKPTSFEDIVAVNALYRPGPMEYIPVYIARKHKQERVVYPHPDLASIMENTYGVLVYQEQIMQIAHKIAGFSLGQADILRRAVSKKLDSVMAEQKEAFLKGCLANGYEQSVAEEIFAWIVKFSNYGFNRSHAVAYSMIAYQLAYLKAHYPVSFFAEILSSVANQQDKVLAYMKEAKTFQLTVLAPSINRSFGKYSVENNNIRMGLLSIKGIGNQVVKEIVRVRKQGMFKNLFDFCMRISLRIVNRQALELLILAGAFDDTYANRASLLASIDQALEQGELFREFRDQPSLFHDKIELEANYVEMEDFTVMRKLADEKELLGIYVTSHPLTAYRTALQHHHYMTMTNAKQMIGKRNVKSAVIVQSIKTIRTKRGDPMAFITIGDETDDLEAVVFPDVFRQARSLLEEEKPIVVKGKMESRNNRVQLLVSEVQPFAEDKIKLNRPERLFIKVSEQNSGEALKKIKDTAHTFPGGTPIIMYTVETKKTYQLASTYNVHPEPECINVLKSYFGNTNVILEEQN
ncbi:DNA polymerase III subunit alpha [Lentibacillus populi]|uniref:DNA polymerase III subunit alpha n=1 Tax=Lentibacillus populi TaxID=1827502 RepID=A0A9W5TU72_9BACI|nr:DNA polymerase III subunit alpha [Lentibacillus populi]GGB27579.1 DNA polymerase III subunit alpha [Lentibacillus populi]